MSRMNDLNIPPSSHGTRATGSVIQVTECPPGVDEEAIDLHFCSNAFDAPDILAITCSGNAFYVTFTNESERSKVLRKSRHTICGSHVTVTPVDCIPEDTGTQHASVDNTSVLVKGIPLGTSRDTLSHFLEKHIPSMVAVVETRTGKDPSLSVVIFDGEISGTMFTSMAQRISSERFLGTFLTVQPVEQPSAVLVTGLKDDKFMKEKLNLYFESRKSNGGPVRDVTLLQNGKVAVVNFQNPEHAKRVAQNMHILEDVHLHVGLHYQEIGYDEENDEEEEPNDNCAIEFPADPHILAFLRVRPSLKRPLVDKLKDIHGSLPPDWLDIPNNQMRVEVEESDVSKMGGRDQWEKKCTKAIQEFLDQFTTKSAHFPDFVWPLIKEECELYEIYSQESVDVLIDEASHTVRVTGFEAECQKLLKQFARLQKEEQGRRRKEKEEEKETTKVLEDQNKAKLELIQGKGVSSIPSGVVVMIRSREGHIEFKGKASHVDRAFSRFLEIITSIKESSIHISENFARIMVTAQGVAKIRAMLRKAGLDAVHETVGKGSECSLRFYSFDPETTDKAAKYTQDKLMEQRIHIQKAKLSFLQTDPWKKLQDDLLKDLCIMVEIVDARDSKDIKVYGLDDDVKVGSQMITDHLGQKSVSSETLSILPGQAKYIIESKGNEIKKLEKSKGVQIEFDHNGKVSIQGPADKIKEAEVSLRSIVDGIDRKHVTIKQPGMATNLQSGFGTAWLGDLEKKNRVKIFLKATAQHPSSAVPPPPISVPSLQQLNASFTTAEGVTLTLVEGKIEQQVADVIVNSIKFDMDLNAGNVSSAIAQAAGPQLQQECTKLGSMSNGEMKKSVGFNLKCNAVYHVCCPDWKAGEEKTLSTLMSLCLTQANQDGISTIAFPTIGTGNLKFPRDIVADVMIRETIKFSTSNPQTKVKDIRFVLYPQDKDSVAAFRIKLLQVQGRPGTVRLRRRLIKPSTPGLTINPKSPHHTEAEYHGVTIQIQQGDLTKDRVDVIVNTTDDKMNFGKLGLHIIQQGGQSIKDECDQQASNVKKGDIIVTGAGQLPFKKVYHMVLTHVNLIHDSVEKCCGLADKYRCSSISFPAIGTGNANVDVAQSAKQIISGILDFVRKSKPQNLRSVCITIFDQRHVGQFHSELRCRGMAAAAGTTTGMTINSEKPDFLELSYNSASIQIKQGNVIDETVDVIVNTVDPNLNMGALGDHLVKIGGADIKKELQTKKKHALKGAVLDTTPGTLPFKRIYHVVIPPANQIHDSIQQCLLLAEKFRCSSIAFPAVGTGKAHVDPAECAKEMMSGILDTILEKRLRNLSKVCVTIFDKRHISVFLDEARSRVRNARVSGAATGSRIGRRQSILKKQANTVLQRVVLEIFGKKDDVAKAVEAIEDFIMKSTKKKTMNYDSKKLTKADISEILDLGVERGVTVTIDSRTSTIVIEGYSTDVTSAESGISKIIHKKIEDRDEEERATAMQRRVQWYCLDASNTSDRDPFGKITNYRIEKAFSAKKNEVEYEEDGVSCTLDFKSMTERDHSTGAISQVIREPKDASMPANWSAQPVDNGEPRRVHLVEVKVGDREFNNVVRQFNASFDSDGQPRKTVVQILRIQNPDLYKQYRTFSDKLKRENKGMNIEWSLFHGTSEDKCDHIYNHGFNRSFSGLNVGAMYGKGVYFAKNATYSADPKYCSPNGTGERFMFQAKVLVGTFTKGEPKMLTPPPKDPSKPLITYNSVVNDEQNPTIFVIFFDAQAYPEYLIKFKA